MTVVAGSKEDGDQPLISVSGATAITPHNQALYEFGKDELIKSIANGRDFVKSMVTVSTGAVAVYTGLVKFVLGDKFIPTGSGSLGIFALNIPVSLPVLFAAPAVLFLISSVIFAWAAMPRAGTVSLDLPAQISTYHDSTLLDLIRKLRVGFVVFCLANLVALVVLLNAIQPQVPQVFRVI
jgi:hypothetical protein